MSALPSALDTELLGRIERAFEHHTAGRDELTLAELKAALGLSCHHDAGRHG